MNRALTDNEIAMKFGSDYLTDMKALSAGKINLKKFQQNIYKRNQEAYTSTLMEYRRRGEWENFIDITLAVCEVMPIAFQYYAEVPDNLKYNFAIDAYMQHGDSVPAVRKAVRGARRYGKPCLPPDMATLDEITVYRAGEEPIDKSKYRISWTTDKDVALFFLNDYIGRHASHLYRAKIKPEKVIAYTNDRNEKEIMQYNGVYDIEDITEQSRSQGRAGNP